MLASCLLQKGGVGLGLLQGSVYISLSLEGHLACVGHSLLTVTLLPHLSLLSLSSRYFV